VSGLKGAYWFTHKLVTILEKLGTNNFEPAPLKSNLEKLLSGNLSKDNLVTFPSQNRKWNGRIMKLLDENQSSLFLKLMLRILIIFFYNNDDDK